MSAGTAWVGSRRSAALSQTLTAAAGIAADARVTRLADLSGLDPIGLPVFQAIRPDGRCLSVSLGKGLTPRAAMASALMEAIETDVAERIGARWSSIALTELGPRAAAIWNSPDSPPLGIRLDPTLKRDWIAGFDLANGDAVPLPLDLVSMDFTRTPFLDMHQCSVGLASGNSRQEAMAVAIGELVEHHLLATWRDASIRDRVACEIDLATIDAPDVLAVLERIRHAGRRLRLWSMGHANGIAAFESIITEHGDGDTNLPPALGTACHTDRAVAACGAILEAAQARAAMIAGSRDDFVHDRYTDPQRRTFETALSLLAYDCGLAPWTIVPTRSGLTPLQNLDHLRRVAERWSPLPILAAELPQPHPALHVVKVIAPGLACALRVPRAAPVSARAIRSASVSKVGRSRKVLFVGPTLARVGIPDDIEVRPPAVAGDLCALLRDPPVAVGLIDGAFETAPSVWHKEILDLLAARTVVLGAGSLGAIRAAELHTFGMIGIGAVFDAYRDGRIRREDAVMVSHAPAELDYRPLSVALVDAETALEGLSMAAIDRRKLQRIVRTMPFRQRTWPAILAIFQQRTGRPAPVLLAALEEFPSIKTRDALALVDRLRGPIDPPAPSPRPPLTRFYRALLANA